MDQDKSSLIGEVKKYVSNVDKDIYTVSNLPEEVVAVIFAYVSRSPKGFRENIGVVIEEEQLGQERAAKFHEKWVLNYGHASVAEHAAVHVGLERVSRLFSSLLELSNEYLSFTEYSQRYQKPEKGDFYVPEELEENPALRTEYIELNNFLYDIYAEINDRLFEFLKNTVPVPEGMEESRHLRALEKVAFEDARYALNLATFTNLGMTANARAIEDSLSKLLSSKYPEVRQRAEEIKEEVRFSVPTLVKYADQNEYITGTREELEEICRSISDVRDGIVETSPVKLIDWTGKGKPAPEEFTIDKMVGAILFEHSRLSYGDVVKELENLDLERKLEILTKTVENLGKFDNPINVFKLVSYETEFTISEACWHQLLRHRKVTWIFKEPGVSDGITIPPNVKEAGVEELLSQAAETSEELYERLMNENMPQVASYVVTNAHKRRILGSFDLWELYHLINLRMSEGAQWDIKNVIKSLSDEIGEHHPNLVAPALGRVG